MREVSGFRFPETEQEAIEWLPQTRVLALHRNVLAVARTRIEGMWACYIFPVPGMSHSVEAKLWRTEGVKQPEDIARAIFPIFDGVQYSR